METEELRVVALDKALELVKERPAAHVGSTDVVNIAQKFYDFLIGK